MTNKYDEGIGHFLTTLRNADWLVNKLKKKKTEPIKAAGLTKEYDDLIEFSTALDGLYDCNGESYSIDQDVYKALNRFETAYYQGLFINEERQPAADLMKKLLSGLESKLIAAGHDFDSGNFTQYLQDLKMGKIPSNKHKPEQHTDDTPENNNNTDTVSDITSLTEKEQILLVLEVMHGIQESTYDKWSTNTLKSFFDVGQDPTNKDGATVEIKKEIAKICQQIDVDPEYVYTLFSNLYVKNRLNLPTIYTPGYEPYVSAELKRNGYTMKYFLRATIEYSIMDCLKKMSKQSEEAKKLHLIVTEMSGVSEAIADRLAKLPDDTGLGLEIQILLAKLKSLS